MIEALVLVLAVAVSLLAAPIAAAVGTAVYDSSRHIYAEQAHTRHTVAATVTDVPASQQILRTCTTTVSARCTRPTPRAARWPTPPATASLRGWHTDGDMVRSAYTLRPEDDDWGRAGTLVRDVMDEAERERLVDTVVGHLRAGAGEPVLQRAFDYWRNIDRDLGDRIEKGVRQ